MHNVHKYPALTIQSVKAMDTFKLYGESCKKGDISDFTESNLIKQIFSSTNSIRWFQTPFSKLS